MDEVHKIFGADGFYDFVCIGSNILPRSPPIWFVANLINDIGMVFIFGSHSNWGTSWEDIRTYANKVVKAIRSKDKKAVILIGTPTWSQDVDAAAQHSPSLKICQSMITYMPAFVAYVTP